MTPDMYKALIIGGVLSVFLAMSQCAYQDELDEAAYCAEMVEQGAWPEEVCHD